MTDSVHGPRRRALEQSIGGRVVLLESKEERIRKRANVLWEEDGAKEGCDDEYWRKARELVEEEVLLGQTGFMATFFTH